MADRQLAEEAAGLDLAGAAPQFSVARAMVVLVTNPLAPSSSASAPAMH